MPKQKITVNTPDDEDDDVTQSGVAGQETFEIRTGGVTSITFDENGEVDTEYSPEEMESYEEYLKTLDNEDEDIAFEIPEPEDEVDEPKRPKKQPSRKIETDDEEDTDSTVEDAPIEEVEDEVKPPKKSRSQERVLQSRREVQEARNKEAEERQKRIEAEVSSRKANIEKYEALELLADARAETFKAELQSLNTQLTKAIDEGDASVQAEIQTKISNTQVAQNYLLQQRQTLKEGITQLKTEFKEFEKTAANPQPANVDSTIPEAAELWLEGKEFLSSNEAYAKLPKEIRSKALKIRQAMKEVVKEVMEDGFDQNDPSFYEEIDLRMEDKFSFYQEVAYGITNSVSSENNSSDEETLKKPMPKPTAKDKAKKVPVMGSNPTSSKSSSTENTKVARKGGIKVTVSKEQREIFKNYVEPAGITWEQYVTDIARQEKLID